MRLSLRVKYWLAPICRQQPVNTSANKIKVKKTSSRRDDQHLEDDLKVRIGLEIHARILSKSKIFSDSDCFNINNSPPNTSVAFFDAALPGTMPTLNRRCVEAALQTALALKCHINSVSCFERKHYFYGDLPAGYQITQQRQPIALNGMFTYPVISPRTHRITYKDCRIRRIQLEHDSARSLQVENLLFKLNDQQSLPENTTLVDLNRAGMGLMEIVTDPDFEEAFDSYSFSRELALMLRSIGTCDAAMGEGGFRVDVNVSVHKVDKQTDQLLPGVRVELKNLNSFNAVLKGTEYEIRRQKELIKRGEKVKLETRTYDTNNGKTISLRTKEDQYDYRFMPEPNLLPLMVRPSKSLNLTRTSNGQFSCSNNPELIIDPQYVNELTSANVTRAFCADLDQVKHQLSEKILPQTRRDGLIQKYALTHENAFVFVANNLDLILEEIIRQNVHLNDDNHLKLIKNVLMFDYLNQINTNSVHLDRLSIQQKASKIMSYCDLLKRKLISRRIKLTVFTKLFEEVDKSALDIVKENNWFIIDDEQTIVNCIRKLFEQNPKTIDEYRNKEKKRLKIFDFFVGRVHKDLNECANPDLVDKLVLEHLKKLKE